jgi:hypothetical protein
MISKIITEFNENIEGLRDFSELINPFLEEHQKKEGEKHLPAIKPVNLAIEKHLESDAKRIKEIDLEIKSLFDGEIEVISEEGEDGERESIQFKFLSGDSEPFNNALTAINKSGQQVEQLYKSSLISLISTIEWFYVQLLHFHYDKHPESAGIKNKTLTLSDLKSFETFKDAEKFLIEEKIESSVRASFKDWIETLKTDLNLKMGYLKEFEDEIFEIYQRRNILVHNGGVVNSIYLSKVSDSYKENLKIGDVISIDQEYLFKSMNRLHLVFSLFAFELWKKLEPENDERGIMAMNLGYKYLTQSDWSVSHCANYFLMQDKKMPVAGRTAAELNVLLCKKRIQGFEAIKPEFEKIDYSDKALVFQLALAALKEDKETFFRHLPQVIKTEEISHQELFDFPIFEEMRVHQEFEDFCTENKITNANNG